MRQLVLTLALLLTAGPAFALGQPNVNLGFTSFLDGGPPAGPGHYLSEYLQYYTADTFVDGNGDKFADPRLDVWVLMNQFIYQSDTPLLFGGKWGLNLMLPVVNVDADVPNQSGIGDLLVGPYLQWDPVMGPNGPVFMHRFELQVILPTGEYDEQNLINPGSNHFSLNPYWAATWFVAPRTTVSWRLHYLWNGTNDEFTLGGDIPVKVDLEPGQAVHGNFAADYELLPNQLRLGVNGYFFEQVSDTKVDGVAVKEFEESVFAIGPGAVWHFSQDAHLFLNAYFESDAKGFRPEGERYNLRFVYHF